MKKVFTKYIAALSVFSFLAGFFVSCGDNSGLGAAIDQIAPQISLISHSDNDTVPVEFTLAGTVWDNEKVSSFTIDFDDADLHYKIVPGGKWYKKTSVQDWTQLSDTEASCNANGLTWYWTLLVDTEEASTAWTEDTYEFTAVAQDLIGNSGKSSKLDCSLIVDTANPDVSVYKPDLFKSTYASAVSSMESYQLKDGNVIARLLNGDLKFSGRQSGSLSFKELLIEFDDGDTSKLAGNTCLQTNLTAYPSLTAPTATAQQVADTVMLSGETEKPEVYYSKLITEDSRSWEFTVKADEWVSETKNPSLQTGKHLIRVVASSVSNSYAWEKKVLGYFVWWPEADTPWITTYAGDDEDKGSSAYEVYPSSNFSGTAQDDDGIKSLSYVIEKKDNDTFKSYSSGNLSLSEAGAKYSAWAVTTPSENANYRITVTVVDLYGKSSAVTKYFKILDVSPPKIEILAPLSGSSAIANSNGTINFEGTVSDDGTVTSLYVAFLNSNPLVNTAVQNKINYMSGSSSTALWTSGIAAGYTDSDGNIIYKIDLGTPVVQNNKNVYSFSKSFNLFDDLKIDGTSKTIEALDFVFRAEDSGGTNSVQVLSLSGDTEAPEVAITKLVLKENGNVKNTYNFKDNETPTLPKIQSGYTAELSGTWSDNSTANWIDKYKLKICDLDLTWNDNTISATMNKAGTWTASVTSDQLPTASGIIKAKLTDFGGNSKTASQSVFIESSEAGLESIGCENDDGAYKAGEEIQITLEFTKSTDVTYTTAPTLTLNNGKTATYSSGSGYAKHIYTYTVAIGDDITRLDVTNINANGAEWTDTSSGTQLKASQV
uniref:hypothetical protein n=1 Tax=Treponema sp. TaxID=166 RepID=UPI00388E390B